MKFMFFFYPALAATLEERRRMRPIARHTEPWQKMFGEVAELSRLAEDLGFDAVTFPEHHLHTEGAEMGNCRPRNAPWTA
jgi:alkanesulfonate monooxygenase SsuD/methylene tetrahydromethanopterin reductase-like flavin-dependent oxidoreductase (luciferase family)